MAGRIRAILRTDFQADAYIDQTGLAHDGYVVYEHLLIKDTTEHFDVNDGYQTHKNHGIIALDTNGRRFRTWTETIAYSGGVHVVSEESIPGLKGHWHIAPASLAGYCTTEGLPVEHILSDAKTPVPSTPSDLIYGNAFAQSAAHTVRLALNQGTPRAFATAVDELQGITRVALHLHVAPTVVLALAAEQRRMQSMADLRQQIQATLKAAKGTQLDPMPEEPTI